MLDCLCLSHNGFLTERGYAELAQQNSLEGLTPRSDAVILDKVGSVSALRDQLDMFDMCDHQIDEQHRRFLNGY